MPPPPSRPRRRWLWRFRDERGVTFVEYGLVIALIAIVVAAGATVLGKGLSDSFDDAGSVVTGVSGNGHGAGGNGQGNQGQGNGNGGPASSMP